MKQRLCGPSCHIMHKFDGKGTDSVNQTLIWGNSACNKKGAIFLEGFALTGGAGPGPNWDMLSPWTGLDTTKMGPNKNPN